MKSVTRILMVVAILAGSTLGGFLASHFGAGLVQAAPERAAFGPGVKLTLLTVPRASLTDVSPTAAKIADIGTITVENSASMIEVTYQGRVGVNVVPPGRFVIYELRIDGVNGAVAAVNYPSGLAQYQHNDTGDLQVTFSGYWYNLSPGVHTVSVWARTDIGSATGAFIGLNIPRANLVTVKEFLPFGTTYLPNVAR